MEDLWPMIDQAWQAFIHGFCKVEFLCYNREPNWLGLGLFIGFIVWLAASFVREYNEIRSALATRAQEKKERKDE